jgi:hypothetical protein
LPRRDKKDERTNDSSIIYTVTTTELVELSCTVLGTDCMRVRVHVVLVWQQNGSMIDPEVKKKNQKKT